MHFIFCIILLPSVFAQTCQKPTGEGPCLMGFCPTGTTCLQDGSPDGICCTNTDIITATTRAPTAAPTTARTTVRTTAAVITAIPCVDKLNPKTGVSDCSRRSNLCNDNAYYTLMTEQCPRTCARCPGSVVTTTQSSTACVDKVNPSTGLSDCTRMASFCTNSAYYTLMTEQCPRTCNRCTGGSTCVDKLNPATGRSDCPGMASFCTNSVYYTLMTEQCPRTCGRCSG